MNEELKLAKDMAAFALSQSIEKLKAEMPQQMELQYVIAQYVYARYCGLRKAGFTEEQAMLLIK